MARNHFLAGAPLLFLLAACNPVTAGKDGYQPKGKDPAMLRISEAVKATDGAYRSVAASGGVSNVRGGISSDAASGDPAVPAPKAPTSGEKVKSGTSSGGTDSTPPQVVLPTHAVQPVTITWNGELESLLIQLASRGGYNFTTTGQRPPTPMVLSIVADEEPLFGIVRRAGMMTPGYADIAFNPATKTITLHYKG